MRVSSSRCGLGAVAALVAMGVLLTATSASAQTADEVIAKNIKAQGGEKALTGLKCLERVGKVSLDGSFGQMEGVVEEICVPYKKVRRVMDLTAFVRDEGWDGKVAWREDMMGLQELEGEQANQIKQSCRLNPFIQRPEGTKVEKLDDETVEDVDYYVIQMTPHEQPAIKFYIDKKTGQIAQTSLTQENPQFGEVEVTVKMSEYKTFGPVTLATKQDVTIGDLFQIETTYTDVKVNGKVDDSVFAMPSDEPKEESKK